jgi:hypothetical protein
MKKYNIEGNIDFFSELYKSLDISENSEKTSEDDNLCLITGEPLVDYFVKLNCGHKFNYIPLYNDIKNHKQKFNSMESSFVKHDEIRCPYCRNKQQELLLYHEEIGLPKIHGVNFIDPNRKKYQASLNNQYTKCQYLTPNPKYDPSGNEHIEKATEYCQLNCKFFTCLNNAYMKISDFIEGYNGEEKILCYSHKQKTLKDHNSMLKTQAKEQAKQVKLKAKEEIKKAKEEAKLKAKEEKIGIKKKPKSCSENLVLGPSVVEVLNSSHSECIEILKSGPNKGKQCGVKTSNSVYCKRHKKIEMQINSESTPEI